MHASLCYCLKSEKRVPAAVGLEDCQFSLTWSVPYLSPANVSAGRPRLEELCPRGTELKSKSGWRTVNTVTSGKCVWTHHEGLWHFEETYFARFCLRVRALRWVQIFLSHLSSFIQERIFVFYPSNNTLHIQCQTRTWNWTKACFPRWHSIVCVLCCYSQLLASFCLHILQ